MPGALDLAAEQLNFDVWRQPLDRATGASAARCSA
jgi:hypothetical protein